MPAFWFKLAIKIAFATIYISKLPKPQYWDSLDWEQLCAMSSVTA